MRNGKTLKFSYALRFLVPSSRWLCTCLLVTAPAIANAQLLKISATDEPAEIAQVSLEKPASVEPKPIV
ncbi:MAG: hypothetical protein AAF497_23660, partial [Planctomycetota bacterium]